MISRRQFGGRFLSALAASVVVAGAPLPVGFPTETFAYDWSKVAFGVHLKKSGLVPADVLWNMFKEELSRSEERLVADMTVDLFA